MKILLATYGSRGDVQPMLALALALQSNGHQVLLAGPPETAIWVRSLNCPFYPLGSNMTTFMDRQDQTGALLSIFSSAVFLRREIRTQFETFMKIAKDADLMIASSLVCAMSSVAEVLKRPYYYLLFTPQLLPSDHHPYPIFAYQSMPKWFNRLTWLWARIYHRCDTAMTINRYRRRLKLVPTNDSWRLVLGRHVIVASDAAIACVPDDVKRLQCTQTGYMHLQQSSSPLGRLDAFIEAGPPPIYAGFGSMSRKDQADSLKIVIEAARSARQRLIVGKSWLDSSSYEQDKDILMIGRYAHGDLFPRMGAVIHHGGAGTTATAAICGAPQIIVPHVLDQYYWGKQIQQQQLGPPPIRRSKLNAHRLAKAIRTCVENSEIKDNVQDTAQQIRRTDGVKRTVDAILDTANMALSVA